MSGRAYRWRTIKGLHVSLALIAAFGLAVSWSGQSVAQGSNPNPELSVQIPASVKAGESFRVRVEAINMGGWASEGYINLSFPNCPMVHIVAHDATAPREEHYVIQPGGRELWRYPSSGEVVPTYPLAETRHRDWATGETHHLEVEVIPPSGLEEVVVFVRASLSGLRITDLYIEPTASRQTDQQNFPVYVYHVEVIPPAPTLPPPTPAPSLSPTRFLAPTPRPDGTIVHVVQAGETLFGIALMYGVTLNQIRALNDLPSDVLWVGQELVIAISGGTPIPTILPTPTATPVPPTASPAPAARRPPPTLPPEPLGFLGLAFGAGLLGVIVIGVVVAVVRAGHKAQGTVVMTPAPPSPPQPQPLRPTEHTMPPRVAGMTGQILVGRYRVDEFLGRGGMADVYRAWDAKRAVYVAIKRLNEDLAEDYVFLRRFAREAHALELLQHPHIVRFFGFEESQGLAFLVMEYVDGVTLRRRLKLLGRPLTLPEALGVLQPVCSGLHYAHGMGIFHCDVKPANIFIEQSGQVVLGDFGIARLSESATVTVSTPGTPAYMAPEQCQGEEVDTRTDIYGLGITTYEMLTLDRPFKGDTKGIAGSRGERVRWEQIHAQVPRPSRIRPQIPTDVEEVILKALAKDPNRRYQDAIAFYEDLSRGRTVDEASLLQGGY